MENTWEEHVVQNTFAVPGHWCLDLWDNDMTIRDAEGIPGDASAAYVHDLGRIYLEK